MCNTISPLQGNIFVTLNLSWSALGEIPQTSNCGSAWTQKLQIRPTDPVSLSVVIFLVDYPNMCFLVSHLCIGVWVSKFWLSVAKGRCCMMFSDRQRKTRCWFRNTRNTWIRAWAQTVVWMKLADRPMFGKLEWYDTFRKWFGSL